MDAAGGTKDRSNRATEARLRLVVEPDPVEAGAVIAERLNAPVADPSLLPKLTALQRVLERTEANVENQLRDALSARHGLVSEVARLRSAATAVVVTEEALATAKADLARLGPLPEIVVGPEGTHAEAAEAEPEAGADDQGVRGGSWWAVYLAAAVTLAATVGLLVAEAPIVAGLVLLVGAFLTAQLLGRARRLDDEADRSQARSALEHASVEAERTEQPVPEVAMALARQRREVWEQRHADREAIIARCQRAVGDARHAWTMVAGPDADPGALGDLLRRRYPALDTEDVRGRHPAGRAARRAIAATAGPGSTLVLVEPFAEVEQDQRAPLRSALDTLAAETPVVVVVADRTVVPEA